MSTDELQLTARSSPPAAATLNIEQNGVNQIAENERKGQPRGLFWPWFAGNISVFSISNGSFVLGFGLSFVQAAMAAILGVVVSNLFCGVIAIAGKRASAPTMTISRSVFGVRGNRFPSALSWFLTLGWETVLAAIAVLATNTILQHLGWNGGIVTKTVAMIVIVGLIASGGMLGFDLIMKMQRWITGIVGVLTVLYMIFASTHVDFAPVASLPNGGFPAFIGAMLFTMTGFGLGWVNSAADYSRYLPRSASGKGVMGWTTFGSSLGPIILLIFGLLLAGSSKQLSDAIDSILMIAGVIYVVFFAADFLGPFQGFLITLGVPVAAWCGIFLADIALRRRDYAEAELFMKQGRYGDIRRMPIALILLGTAIGWGLVTNTAAPWLGWQGYFLGPFGLGGTGGAWASANLGVVVALLTGFLGYLALACRTVRAQENLPVGAEVPLTNAEVQQLATQEA
jgi:NCS1 family nucleobase:cation symporter-1